MSMVNVAVSSDRAGTAPLTWGQGSILTILGMLRERAWTANLATYNALSWIGRLVTVYEALRTRYVEEDGQLKQILDAAGEVPVEIIDVAAGETAWQVAETFGDWDEGASSIPRPTQDAVKTLEWVHRKEKPVHLRPIRHQQKATSAKPWARPPSKPA
jgi:hypothetical protein